MNLENNNLEKNNILEIKNGRLDLVLGTMFSGKTSNILSKITKYAILNYSIIYINIEFDNRSENCFSTHNPLFDSKINFMNGESINNNINMIKSKSLMDLDILDYDIIIIDESHFFDDLVEFVKNCLDLNKHIIVAGLIGDFKGNKFGKTLDLIPFCTNIERLHAYCIECAKNKICSIAIYSKKINKCRKSVDIGGSEKYIPVCRFHYNLEQNNNLDLEKIKTKSKNKKDLTISEI